MGRVRQMERPALMRLVDFLLRVRRLAYEEDKSETTNEVEALLRTRTTSTLTSSLHHSYKPLRS